MEVENLPRFARSVSACGRASAQGGVGMAYGGCGDRAGLCPHYVRAAHDRGGARILQDAQPRLGRAPISAKGGIDLSAEGTAFGRSLNYHCGPALGN